MKINFQKLSILLSTFTGPISDTLVSDKVSLLTLTVPVTAIDALQHFETG